MTYEPTNRWIAFVLTPTFSKARLTILPATDSGQEIKVHVTPDASGTVFLPTSGSVLANNFFWEGT